MDSIHWHFYRQRALLEKAGVYDGILPRTKEINSPAEKRGNPVGRTDPQTIQNPCYYEEDIKLSMVRAMDIQRAPNLYDNEIQTATVDVYYYTFSLYARTCAR